MKSADSSHGPNPYAAPSAKDSRLPSPTSEFGSPRTRFVSLVLMIGAASILLVWALRLLLLSVGLFDRMGPLGKDLYLATSIAINVVGVSGLVAVIAVLVLGAPWQRVMGLLVLFGYAPFFSQILRKIGQWLG